MLENKTPEQRNEELRKCADGAKLRQGYITELYIAGNKEKLESEIKSIYERTNDGISGAADFNKYLIRLGALLGTAETLEKLEAEYEKSSKGKSLDFLKTLKQNGVAQDEECKTLSEKVLRDRDELLRQWVSKDKKGLENSLASLHMNTSILKDQLAKDDLNKAVLDCGILIGTIEALDKLIYERDRDLELEILNRRLLQTLYTNNEYIKYINILESIQRAGVITCDELAKVMDMEDYEVDMTIIDFDKQMKNVSFRHLPLVDIRDGAGGKIVYNLSDNGIRFLNIRHKKQAELFDYVREVYGARNLNGEISNKQIDIDLLGLADRIFKVQIKENFNPEDSFKSYGFEEELNTEAEFETEEQVTVGQIAHNTVKLGKIFGMAAKKVVDNHLHKQE